MTDVHAICTGCGVDSATLPDYKDEPVTEDGSYADGKFVCNECYIRLTMRGMDIGTPATLQQRAANLKLQNRKA